MIPLVILFLLMFLVRSSYVQSLLGGQATLSLAFGFILIFAFLFGKEISRFNLPQITGFILAGIICGPYVLGFLSQPDVRALQLLDGLALGLIALTAGGEMRLPRLKARIKDIGSLVIFQTVVIIGGFLCFGLVFPGSLSFFLPGENLPALPIFLLLGTLATATSPSTTIAVITEARSKGNVTDLVLGAAVVKDFFVIIFFAFSLSLAQSMIGKEEENGVLTGVLLEVGGSVAIGIVVGLGLVFYLKFIRRELTVFILGVAFFTYQISHNYGLHPLLICLVAGFLVENFSPHGEGLIQAIEKVSLPVFVIFFAISGASLDMNALAKSWVLAVIFALLRGGLKFGGSLLGAKIAKSGPFIEKWSWAGFISQAGVTLGMAVIIEKTFPEWGTQVKALILAVIALNQIIGPVFLQKLLNKCGESGKKTG
ncbi:MAG: cation:proton antiporter [Acidobacteriota bacterium]